MKIKEIDSADIILIGILAIIGYGVYKTVNQKGD